MCEKGDLVCTARVWSTSATDTAMEDIYCYACDKAGSDCDKAASAAATKGVAGSIADAKFKLEQNDAKDTAVLTVKDVRYQPNSKTAVGRFYYKPSTTRSLYAASTI